MKDTVKLTQSGSRRHPNSENGNRKSGFVGNTGPGRSK